MARGFGGAVVAGHASSTQAGLRALEAGGSAVDACLAMAACDWVAMPDMCGPGGDLFALWRTPDGRVQALNGGGPAPMAYVHPARDDERIAYCLVPGAPAAFTHLASQVGRLGLDAVLAPASTLAERGTVVGARLDRQAPGTSRRSVAPCARQWRPFAADQRPAFDSGAGREPRKLGQVRRSGRGACEGRTRLGEGRPPASPKPRP